ncbi:MAG: SDR family NAD(P)-dependent oxidoreductase, partial [Spirochaetota bacterium]
MKNKRILDFYRNKRVVVYGSSGGLGQALCMELSGIAAHLVLAGRNAEKLEALQGRLQGHLQGPAEVWAVDGKELAARVQESEVDGLIIATGKTLYDQFCGAQDWQQVRELYGELLDVNFFTVLQLALDCLPCLRERKGFLHVCGSYACFFPVPYQAVYSASKAALLSFVQAVAREEEAEFGRSRVRGLLSISLIGGMATDMYYQSNLYQQFARFENLLIASPQKVAV